MLQQVPRYYIYIIYMLLSFLINWTVNCSVQNPHTRSVHLKLSVKTFEFLNVHCPTDSLVGLRTEAPHTSVITDSLDCSVETVSYN